MVLSTYLLTPSSCKLILMPPLVLSVLISLTSSNHVFLHGCHCRWLVRGQLWVIALLWLPEYKSMCCELTYISLCLPGLILPPKTLTRTKNSSTFELLQQGWWPEVLSVLFIATKQSKRISCKAKNNTTAVKSWQIVYQTKVRCLYFGFKYGK